MRGWESHGNLDRVEQSLGTVPWAMTGDPAAEGRPLWAGVLGFLRLEWQFLLVESPRGAQQVGLRPRAQLPHLTLRGAR